MLLTSGNKHLIWTVVARAKKSGSFHAFDLGQPSSNPDRSGPLQKATYFMLLTSGNHHLIRIEVARAKKKKKGTFLAFDLRQPSSIPDRSCPRQKAVHFMLLTSDNHHLIRIVVARAKKRLISCFWPRAIIIWSGSEWPASKSSLFHAFDLRQPSSIQIVVARAKKRLISCFCPRATIINPDRSCPRQKKAAHFMLLTSDNRHLIRIVVARQKAAHFMLLTSGNHHQSGSWWPAPKSGSFHAFDLGQPSSIRIVVARARKQLISCFWPRATIINPDRGGPRQKKAAHFMLLTSGNHHLIRIVVARAKKKQLISCFWPRTTCI